MLRSAGLYGSLNAVGASSWSHEKKTTHRFRTRSGAGPSDLMEMTHQTSTNFENPHRPETMFEIVYGPAQ